MVNQKCPYCGSDDTIKNGFKYRKVKHPLKMQKHICYNCLRKNKKSFFEKELKE